MSSYLLPCHCGESISIRTTQAGEKIKCDACGTETTAPTMREIRSLKSVDDTDASLGNRKKTWSVAQGLLFSAGMAVAVLALATMAYFGWYRHMAKRGIQRPEFEDISFQRDITTINLNESWDVWTKQFRNQALGMRRTPAFILYRKLAERMQRYMMAAAGVTLLGLFMAASSVLFGRSGPPGRRP